MERLTRKRVRSGRWHSRQRSEPKHGQTVRLELELRRDWPAIARMIEREGRPVGRPLRAA